MFNVLINSDTTTSSAENVTFKDQNPSYSYSVAARNDSTYNVADRDDADLGNFFSRPVKIQEFQWSTTTTLYESFNPWTDYFTNPRVMNRITNFGLMRAKLCLKFVINGNGFHYGRILTSYIPLRALDDFTVDRGFIVEDIVGASQRPHIYLDPTTSSGGSMCLPFFWYDNYLEVPDQEWEQMGTIIMHTMQSLQHANGASDSATISVFAWAEDVTLCVPTSSEPGGLTPQIGLETTFDETPLPPPWSERARYRRDDPYDGICISTSTPTAQGSPCSLSVSGVSYDEMEILLTRIRHIVAHELRTYKPHMGTEDEYGKGPISRPASVVARIAGGLSKVPYIGAYARATELAANATSAIATTFGYSKPNYIGHVMPVKIETGNFANTNVEDSCIKLALDAKQELTIDPSTVGLAPADEMTINSIACRESWLTSFPWLVSATSEDMLWQTNVTPMTWAANSTVVPTEVHMTACGFAAMPFRNWYGSMKYRFQVVSSNYHKGRIKIVYDPHGFQSNEYNTNYTYIVDVAEDKDFTVQIGWGSDKPYCVVGAPGVSLIGSSVTPDSVPYTTVPAPTVPGNLANGVLRVYVVNELTIPNSTIPNDVAINVFVSAGEDIQFRNPTDVISNCQYFPQMGVENQTEGDTDDTDEPNKPMAQEIDHTMLNVVSTTDAYDHVFFGETIVSFRQMLKRYNYHTSEVPPEDRALSYVVEKAMFPFYGGLAPGAITNSSGTVYNYGKTTLMNYLTPAYAAWRGGIKYKIVVVSSDLRTTGVLGVERMASGAVYREIDNGLAAGTDLKSFNNKTKLTGLAGMSVTQLQFNTTAEVEIPFQSNVRFAPAKKVDVTTSQPFTVGGIRSHLTTRTNQFGLTLDYYVAAGEDFSLFFYQGPPIMYFDVVSP